MARLDELTELLLKRAIIYPNSEIYNVSAGFYDYGSIGTQIKIGWENTWREHFLPLNANFHEIQTTTIMPSQVFRASGHLEHFVDPVAECKKCGASFRADHLLEDVLGEKFEGITADEMKDLMKKHKIVCTKCKKPFTGIKEFNLMFKASDSGYLRPETAQGPYTAFKREYRANREKFPLGLGMIGRAYRNEISPRQLTLRQREFTQAELQIFFDHRELPQVPFKSVEKYKLQLLFCKKKKFQVVTAKDAVKKTKMPEFFIYFMVQCQKFYEKMGLLDKFRFAELSKEEKAFYNKYHWDMEMFLPSFNKYIELGGFHYRTDHDLKGHSKVSGEKLKVRGEVPHVLELSFGVDRNVLGVIDNAFIKEKDRFYLGLPPKLAPYDIAVFPLVNKEGLPEKAMQVYKELSKTKRCFYDSGGSIGRRYARVDEIGVPLAVTVDFDSLKKKDVTVRDRNTTKQKRVKLRDLGCL